MKTQLLHDIDENSSKAGPPPPPGSAPGTTPATGPPAAPADSAAPAGPAAPPAQPSGGGSLIERAQQAPRDAAPVPPPADITREPTTPSVWRRTRKAAPDGARSGASVQRAADPGPVSPLPTFAPATPPPSPASPASAPRNAERAFDPRYGEARVPPPRPTADAPVAPVGAPDLPRADTTLPLHGLPTPDGTTPSPDIPDWLSERLREEAQRERQAQWSSLWKRRAVTWSIAGGLLAAVAAGGLWLYEDSRVDGALGVVARTNPEQPASGPGDAAATLGALPSPAPAVDRSAFGPASNPPSGTSSDTASTAIQAPTPVAPAPEVALPQATPTPIVPLPEVAAGGGATAPAASVVDTPRRATSSTSRSARQESARRNRLAAERRAAADTTADRDPEPARATGMSTRQRREETLMQCRAHGYDQRQCDQRGCEMTKYGFFCKG